MTTVYIHILILTGFLLLGINGIVIMYFAKERNSLPVMICSGIHQISLLIAFLVFLIVSINIERNKYVYLVTITSNNKEYILTYEKNKVSCNSAEITFYTDDGIYISTNQFVCKKILKENYITSK